MKTNYIYSFTKEPFDINLTIMKWQEGCAFVQQQQLVQNIMEAYLLSNCDFIKRLFRLQKCHIKFQIKNIQVYERVSCIFWFAVYSVSIYMSYGTNVLQSDCGKCWNRNADISQQNFELRNSSNLKYLRQ